MDQRIAGHSKNVWLTAESCSLSAFRDLVEAETEHADYPLADAIERNVLIYDAARVREAVDNEAQIFEYMAEWNAAFASGPGVMVFRNTYDDHQLIDDVSGVLLDIISRERAVKGNVGDHFAKAGANARVWNAHEKLCLGDPELYMRYNANDILALVSQSWLGPHYQITAQVNLVYPGGAAQQPHRDYHMGFQTADELRRYPAHVHQLSAALTLQGAIAHCDMSVESGPTKLLPYSQKYLPGYFATLRSEFREYFEKRHVQLALQKGDTLFFNPALFHAAGENRTKDVNRLANLLQVGSGYGRSIEIVRRSKMCKAIFEPLAAKVRAGAFNARECANIIAATAEGYSFPADLDIDSPLSGMAPASQQDIVHQALRENWDADALAKAIDGYDSRRDYT